MKTGRKDVANKKGSEDAQNTQYQAEGSQFQSHELSFSELVKEHSMAHEEKERAPLAFKLYSQQAQQADSNAFRKKDTNSKQASTYVNRKSIHILEEQSKKGQKYVPIHLRTDNDLRKKMDHINRIKQEQALKTEQELKECTFKPAIITTSKTESRRPDEVVDGLLRWNQTTRNRLLEKKKQQDMEELSFCKRSKNADKQNDVRDLSGRLSFRTIPTQSGGEMTLDLSSPTLGEPEEVAPLTPSTKPSTKKYRNKSFNVLLDMIH